MTHKERLAEIEDHINKNANSYQINYLHQMQYLLIRVKELTKALEFYAQKEHLVYGDVDIDNGEIAIKVLEEE